MPVIYSSRICRTVENLQAYVRNEHAAYRVARQIASSSSPRLGSGRSLRRELRDEKKAAAA